MVTKIFVNDGYLSFEGDRLATKDEYLMGDRCVGSIFEALEPGEAIELVGGIFWLDDELDLVESVPFIRDIDGTFYKFSGEGWQWWDEDRSGYFSNDGGGNWGKLQPYTKETYTYLEALELPDVATDYCPTNICPLVYKYLWNLKDSPGIDEGWMETNWWIAPPSGRTLNKPIAPGFDVEDRGTSYWWIKPTQTDALSA